MLYKKQVGYLKQKTTLKSIKIRALVVIGIYSNHVKQLEIKQFIRQIISHFPQVKRPSNEYLFKSIYIT